MHDTRLPKTVPRTALLGGATALLATSAHIATIRNEGVSVFMVEQNANLASQIAQYGDVLQAGRIALSGPAAELARDPRIRDA